MVLVDFAEGVLHLGEGLVEDGLEDAVLLVGEERGEGVAGGAGGGGVGVGGAAGPKKRSMRRMTSGRLARRMAEPMSVEKVRKRSTSTGSSAL